MNDRLIDWDKKLPEKLIEDCHRCNDFIISDDKVQIVLFMIDHYGPENIRKCTAPEP
jgi:hypothetical protein